MYPALTARAAELGIVVASQPGFLSGLGDGFAAAFPGQADQLYAFRSWQRAGITVAGSSDAPVITPDPRTGIRDAILRRTAAGQVIGPDERLTAREALALYTAGGAYPSPRDRDRLAAPGKLADFTVLDRNPLSTDPEQITGIQVLATVVDGTPTHQSGGILFPVARPATPASQVYPKLPPNPTRFDRFRPAKLGTCLAGVPGVANGAGGVGMGPNEGSHRGAGQAGYQVRLQDGEGQHHRQDADGAHRHEAVPVDRVLADQRYTALIDSVQWLGEQQQRFFWYR